MVFSLEGDFGKAAQFPAVQMVEPFMAQHLDGANADAQMLIDPLAVKLIRHARQFDLAVQRFV
jgi:hypothetical protein